MRSRHVSSWPVTEEPSSYRLFHTDLRVRARLVRCSGPATLERLYGPRKALCVRGLRCPSGFRFDGVPRRTPCTDRARQIPFRSQDPGGRSSAPVCFTRSRSRTPLTHAWGKAAARSSPRRAQAEIDPVRAEVAHLNEESAWRSDTAGSVRRLCARERCSPFRTTITLASRTGEAKE
jgi:hypothetical protein